jgi:DivIVA domain-containing protein
MMWFFAVLVVLALGAVAVVAAGRGAPMEPSYDDAPDSLVPAEGPLSAADLRRIRFPLAVRGYRMAEVDALLDRLAEEREEAEARARRDAPADGPTDGPTQIRTDARTDLVSDPAPVEGDARPSD